MDDELEMTARFAPPVPGMTTPVGGVLDMKNIGDRECRVQTKLAWWVGARPADIAATDELGPPALLDAGAVARSALTWWGQDCAGTTKFDSIQVSFFSNDELSDREVPASGLARGPCARPSGDLGGGGWAQAVRRQDFYYPHDVLTQLVPTLIAPATAEVGVPIPFTLILTNVTDRPAVFDHPHPPGTTVSCPKLSFYIGDMDQVRREIDCAKPRSIDPGARASYDFTITTRITAECVAGLRMSFDELPGSFVTSPLTVTGCAEQPLKKGAATG